MERSAGFYMLLAAFSASVALDGLGNAIYPGIDLISAISLILGITGFSLSIYILVRDSMKQEE